MQTDLKRSTSPLPDLPTAGFFVGVRLAGCMSVGASACRGVGAFNVKTGVLKFVNGGHNPPFIQRNGGGFEMLEVLPGVLLGVMEEAEYPVATLTMQPGDSIMLYTDGITEAGDPKIELFEEERALEILNANPDQDMETLTEALKEAVYEFEAGRPQADDITLLGLRYLGEMAGLIRFTKN